MNLWPLLLLPPALLKWVSVSWTHSRGAPWVSTPMREMRSHADDQQAVVVQATGAIPFMSGDLELRPSQVLPGQMVLPLAWRVNDLQNHPALEEGEKRPPRE